MVVVVTICCMCCSCYRCGLVDALEDSTVLIGWEAVEAKSAEAANRCPSRNRKSADQLFQPAVGAGGPDGGTDGTETAPFGGSRAARIRIQRLRAAAIHLTVVTGEAASWRWRWRTRTDKVLYEEIPQWANVVIDLTPWDGVALAIG
jgi:hypothetical protein